MNNSLIIDHKTSDKQVKISTYGAESFGALKKVLLHNPGYSLKAINKKNRKFYLFDKVPKVEEYIKEHNRYSNLLKSLGVEVYDLEDYVFENKDLIKTLPNLAYVHDSSVITRKGAILSKMYPGIRKQEEKVIKEALENLGIPIVHQYKNPEYAEGCSLISPKTVLIANTERHTERAIMSFIPIALQIFEEVIYVKIPKERRFMHSDTIFNIVNEKLALAYLPAFLHSYLITKEGKRKIDFKRFMGSKGIEVINISNIEQHNWGSSFVPINKNTIVHYDFALSKRTENILKSYGVEVIKFHPHALLAGGGSLRCLTLKLLRES